MSDRKRPPFEAEARSYQPGPLEQAANAARSGLERLGFNLSPERWEQYYTGSIPGQIQRGSRLAGQGLRHGNARQGSSSRI